MSEPGSAYRLSVLEERWRSDRSPRVFLQLADELRRAGRPERAVEVLRDGLRWHPESVSGWVALGRNLLDERDPRAAIEALESALERDPGQLVASKLLTEGWIRVGDAERAEASLERARLLSLPDEDREQLAQQIDALRARAAAAAPTLEPERAVAGRRPGEPFELAVPTPLPVLDLERVGPGRRGWRRIPIAHEPFADLLGVPPASGAVERALRGAGIFGGSEPAAGLAPQTEAPPLAAVEPDGDELAFAMAPPPIEVAVPEPPAPLVAPAVTPPVLPVEAIFQPQSIGEEVERETMEEAAALEPASAPEPAAPAPGATATLAALYFSQGHFAEAEAEYRRVLAARPDDTEAAAGLAELARRRAAAAAAAAGPAPRPAGLTARRLLRLRGVYDRLRTARRGAQARVS